RKVTGSSARIASLVWSIGLMASLKRAEEVATPSFPVEFTTTELPVTGVPKIPATKVDFCMPCLPMRIVLASPATPALPISMLLLPVVRLVPARLPRPILDDPVVLCWRAPSPAARLLLPLVLWNKAAVPVAVLLEPALLASASEPTAVLLLPVA